jgi:hypothetical protein
MRFFFDNEVLPLRDTDTYQEKLEHMRILLDLTEEEMPQVGDRLYSRSERRELLASAFSDLPPYGIKTYDYPPEHPVGKVQAVTFYNFADEPTIMVKVACDVNPANSVYSYFCKGKQQYLLKLQPDQDSFFPAVLPSQYAAAGSRDPACPQDTLVPPFGNWMRRVPANVDLILPYAGFPDMRHYSAWATSHLRHRGYTDRAGYSPYADFLWAFHGAHPRELHLDGLDLLLGIVSGCSGKPRFTIKFDDWGDPSFIRAIQGHSQANSGPTEMEGLKRRITVKDAKELFHATTKSALEGIQISGLN